MQSGKNCRDQLFAEKGVLTIPVDKYTQAEYYLPVIALNLPIA